MYKNILLYSASYFRIMFFAVSCFFTITTQARIIYVDPATGYNNNNFANGDGLSWAKPCKDLVHALYWASANDEIWLNNGTYYPVQAPALGTQGADRNAAFFAKDNVRIYGGFSKENGVTSFAARNPTAYLTILSGDIQIDGNNTNNSRRIIYTGPGNGFAVLDGVTVRDAYVEPNSELATYGGALYLNYISPTITNCKFLNNIATQGGAVFCDKSNPTFNSCVFNNNTASNNPAGYVTITGRGGAVFNAGSSPRFNSCSFSGNTALNNFSYAGSNAALVIDNQPKFGNSSPSFYSCTFSGNGGGVVGQSSIVFNNGGAAFFQTCNFTNNPTARAVNSFSGATDSYVSCLFDGNAGGIKINASSTTIYNCTFKNNNATVLNRYSGDEPFSWGGGISLENTKSPFPVISNCLIVNNNATRGGGIDNYRSTAKINNCTIANNTAGIQGGGGTYNEGAGYSGLSSTPIYYAEKTTYGNCIIYGNTGGNGLLQDSMKRNFFVKPTTSSYYIPPSIIVEYLDYTHRPTIANCFIDKFSRDSMGTIPFQYIFGAPNVGVYLATDGGNNVLNVNPLFVQGGFSLLSCSRCVDAGNPAHIPPNSPTLYYDIAGQPRFFGLVDIGCYEKQAGSSGYLTVNTVSICQGTSTVIFGQTQSAAGSYFNTFPAANGCDSVIRTDLVLLPSPKAVTFSINNCGNTGTIVVKPTLGKAPFLVVLDPWNIPVYNIAADSAARFPNRLAGNYSYLLKDANGCFNNVSPGAYSPVSLQTNINSRPILYVDAAAAGDNSGRNFANAFTDLQAALDLTICPGVTQIWVAKGTYYPTKDIGGNYTSSKSANFRMVNNVTIYGGFNQQTGDTTLVRRDWKKNVTILSGEIQKDNILINNSYNVINNAGNNLNNTAVIDGFTISDAANNYDAGGGTTNGGGMINSGSSPTIRNCNFINNFVLAGSNGFGGAMFNKNCAPIISNCQFTGNTASGSVLAFGGAVYNDNSNPAFTNCFFNANFCSNASNQNGGAISSAGGSPVIISNCLFTGNVGGAVATYANNTNIFNCTFYANVAPAGFGGALYNYGGANSTVTNCIMWANNNNNIVAATGSPLIKNSLIGIPGGPGVFNPAYGTNGGGNIFDVSPRFTPSLRISPCSPAKDAGTNTGIAALDLDNNPRLIGSTVDMGCYELQTLLVAYGSTVYVNAAATGLNNGTSWANAFTDLSDALKITNCTSITNIYVSKGTYYPSLDEYDGIAANSQAPTFAMRQGVGIYGGFSVADGIITFAARNPTLYPTILSADHQKDGLQENNCKAVVTAISGLNASSVLDGFTIRDGYNNTTSVGAGFYIAGSSPTITNCVITNNKINMEGSSLGAGAYVTSGSPTFNKCKFIANTTIGTLAAHGGGIYNLNSGTKVYDCEFTGNQLIATSNAFGAGIHSLSSTGILVARCKFTFNSTSAGNSVGAGIYANAGTPFLVENSLFTNNTGGGICADGNNMYITNCTVVNNYSNILTNAGGFLSINNAPTITNSIFYGNNNGNITNFTATPSIKNSLVQGSGGSAAWVASYGTNAGGNVDANPLFNANFKLTNCSPAANSGDNVFVPLPLFDLENLPRIVNSVVDMGCYESTFNLGIYGTKLYVNAGATGTNDGTSWANAFTDLQTALGLAKCINVTEVYVSKGTYYPSSNVSNEIVNNRYSCFRMKNNLSIIGGFSVADGVTTLAARNASLYPAILSGDIQQDNIDGNNVFNVINNYNNGLDTTAVLDGFTITKATNNFTGLGGGVINFNSSPKFLNCKITNNFAGGTFTARGAGMHNISCSPILLNCSFTNNKASGIDNAFGAGISNNNATPKISRCNFFNNDVSAPNPAGSAIYSNGGSAGIDNSLFTNNIGNAICADASTFFLWNNTIANNTGTASRAGGLFFINCSPNIFNTIVYGNTIGSVTNISATPSFFYCDVQGSGGSAAWNAAYGINAGANRDENPLFTPDYQLTACSPLINVGDNGSIFGSLDINNTARIKNGVVDLGCYESNTFNSAVYTTPILYVNANATTGTNDGSSWANAFTNLQNALYVTRFGCANITSIYVSKGTYYPNTDIAGNPTTTRFAIFQMKNNLSIVGGFSVADGVTTLAARNATLYPAILSGEIQQDNNIANNVFNIINNYNTGLDTTAVLDGLTLTGAYNNNTGIGGAIFNYNVSPKFLNCTITNNFVGGTYTARGAGMHNVNGAPILRNCSVTNNTAAGIDNAFGAGISNENSAPKISRSIFSGNGISAPNPAGSALYSNGVGGSIDNSLFVNNLGNAICGDAAIFTFYNNTIANNTGTAGRAGGLFLYNGSNFNILNTIVYGNTGGSLTNAGSIPTFYFCDVEGSGGTLAWNPLYGINGAGNRDQNPLFTTDFKLTECSPLINVADNASVFGSIDLSNTARIKNGVADMGCYESNFNSNPAYNGSQILYVNANAVGANDGTSWANAFTNLQSAINISKIACLNINSIYVSKGTYYPNTDTAGNVGITRLATFQMKNNLSIIGGFSVADGITTLSARNATLYPTILSGDVQQDNNISNNAFNIVTNYNTGLDTTAVLDGFTLTGAYNNNTGIGGAVLNSNVSPKFLNCTITNNFVGGTNTARGAGMHNVNGSPILRNCSITNNTAAGIDNAFGAGISNSNATPTFSRCIFSGNGVSAPNPAGSALYSNGGGAGIDNSLFTNNIGNAICADACTIFIWNNTIANNTGTTGRAGGLFFINSSANIFNTIVYGNTIGSVTNISSAPSFYYCDVQGSGGSAAWNSAYGFNAGANRDEIPLFTTDFKLSPCSPLINAGDNASIFGSLDLSNTSRTKFGTVDMGCYEANTTNNTIYNAASILYVNANATGTNNGTTWADAFTDMQTALNIAKISCLNINTIYVSKGTYYPTYDTAGFFNTRFASFQMKNNLSIIGGFSVADGVVTLGARNASLYPAILSGDIQQDNNISNNAFNIITNYNTGLDTTAVLDGFTLTGAYNNNTGIGGAVFNYNVSPKFLNCTFTNNVVAGTYTARGAGMHNINGSPILRNCSFINNTAAGIDNAFGAGISNTNASLKISRCIFSGNGVGAPNPAGGAIYSNGGGVGSIDNSLFVANSGSAICADGSLFTLYNVTIANNSGTPSRAGGLLLLNNSNFNILNTIVYGNTNGSVTNASSTPTFYYCDVEGSGAPGSWNNSFGINGGGNRDENPLLAADFKLSACSPLINVGDNASVNGSLDLSNTARIKNGVVDIGCYESNLTNTSFYSGTTILYVNNAATGTNDGKSWANAFISLQGALNIAKIACSNIPNIYVSKGTYYPTTDTAGNAGSTRFASFQMKNNLSIIGGFSVADGVTTLAARNATLYPAILSGDVQQDNNTSNNAFNIITNYNNGLDTTAILDGFTLTAAYNNNTGIGGAVFNYNVSPKFLNCTITDNFVGGTYLARGAGMHNVNGSPILVNCSFINNTANGIDNAFGAGISNTNATPKISRSIFTNNNVSSLSSAGGAVYSIGGGGVIDNSLFTNNNASAICGDAAIITFSNNTVTNNSGSASRAGGLFLYGGSNFNIRNSIIYGNANGSVTNAASSPTITYSDVEGSGGNTAWNVAYGINSGGNKDVNPVFTANYNLPISSTLINAGSNALVMGNIDLNNTARVNNGVVDMGCYESNFNSTDKYNGVSILYVNQTAANSSAKNGVSWADAFTDIQDALNVAKISTLTITDIYVSKGSYYPNTNVAGNFVNDRSAVFQMKNNLAIIGGFSVVDGATTFTTRNASLYPTILSGNIQKDNLDSNNTYNVISNYDLALDTTAVLDGFTITNAYNNLSGTGGGVLNYNSSPKFLNCTIINNFIIGVTTARGAGMDNTNASPTLRNCKITNNTCVGSFIACGAGMYNAINSFPKISRCIFTNNSLTALYVNGGAIFNNGGGGSVDNSLFTGNNGAAICTDGSTYTFTNNTLTNNIGSADFGGAMYVIGSTFNIRNTIIYSNTFGSVTRVSSTINYLNCDVEGTGGSTAWNPSYGTNSGGNKDVNPLLATDFKLTPNSPVINMGDNASVIGTLDLASNQRILNSVVDMGAYERSVLTSSLTTVFTCGNYTWNGTTYTVSGTYIYNTTTTMGADSTATLQLTISTNFATLPSAYTSSVQLQSDTTYYSNSCSSLIAKVISTGASPLSGTTIADVWIETNQPTTYVKRHYQIAPDDNAETATAKVTLYFTQSEFDDFNTIIGTNGIKLPTNPTDSAGIANLLIEKYAGTSSEGTGTPITYDGAMTIINPTDANIVWNVAGNRWEVTFSVLGFSGFFVITETTLLPVKWLSVSGKLNSQQQATINWKVQENNVVKYVIEKSNNGSTFSPIGTTISKGDGTNNYTYTEVISLIGKGYYRIKQIDKDGKVAYSTILKLITYNLTPLTTYPNPVIDMLSISGATIGSKATLFDVSGKLLQLINITNTSFTIDMSTYSSGVYILKTDDGQTHKIIKE